MSKVAGRTLRGAAAVLGMGLLFLVAETVPALAEIEQIIVTTRKKAENLEQVPVAATAFTMKDLERYNTDNLEKLSTLTPSLTIVASSSGSGGAIYLRGIGTPSTSAGFEQAVSINLDGIAISRGNAVQQGYFDMAHVEVLKGPQSLYYGKNSPGGIISIRSADPGDSFEALARLGYEFTSREVYGEAIVSGPINDKVGARLAVRGTGSSGFMHNDAPYRAGADPLGFDIPGADQKRVGGKEQFLGRLTLTFKPTDRFDANLKVSGTTFTDDGAGSLIQLRSCPVGGHAQPIFGVSDPAEDCVLNKHMSRSSAPPEIVVDWPDAKGGKIYTDYHSILASLTMNQRFDKVTVSSVTGYYYFKTKYFDNYDFSGSGQVFAGEDTKYTAISEELRANTTFDGPFNLLAGVYYQNTALRFENSSRIAPLPPDPRNGKYHSWERPTRTDGETWSIFGEATINVTDQIELAGGARWTRETKDSSMYNAFVHAYLAALFLPEGQAITDHFVDDNVSPQVTLTWRPNRDLTFYGAYKTGYKSGGFSNGYTLVAGSTADDANFDSEKAQGGEIGAKMSLLDNSMRLNLAAYRYTYKNLQVNVFDAASTSFKVENAAAARTTGLDVDLLYAPPSVDGLTIRGAYNFNKGVYTNFIGACYAGQTPAQGCTELPNNGVPTSQDMSGVPLIFAPRHSGNVGFTYDWAVGNLFRATLATDLRFTSSYETEGLNRPDGRQKGFVTLDASLTLYDDGHGWEFKLIGQNLTNKYYSVGGGDRPLTGSGTGTAAGVPADLDATIASPRQIGVQVTVHFH
ncbi:MAG: TonB-dependent receptor [Alphaproteobacteria bacterium]|nr:TonB-dependent receptor [Alphaproteobacteria bacterium]